MSQLANASTGGVSLSALAALHTQPNTFNIPYQSSSPHKVDFPKDIPASCEPPSQTPKRVSLLQLIKDSDSNEPISSWTGGLKKSPYPNLTHSQLVAKPVQHSKSKPLSLNELILMSNQQQQHTAISSEQGHKSSNKKLSAVQPSPKKATGPQVLSDCVKPMSKLSLSDLANFNMQSSPFTTNVLSNMLPSIELPSHQPRNRTTSPTYRNSMPTVSFQLSQSSRSQNYFSFVMNRSFEPKALSNIHQRVQDKLSQKYCAFFTLYFDFSTPSPDDIIIESQKKGFK